MDEEFKFMNKEECGESMTFAVFLRQPFAGDLAGGNKCVEIRKQPTSYRGDVLICSTPKHEYPGMRAGCCVGVAELYDVVPVEELTEEEWNKSRVRKSRRQGVKGGYALMFRNCRKVIEYPVRGLSSKIGWIPFCRDDLFVYPRYVKYDSNPNKMELWEEN